VCCILALKVGNDATRVAKPPNAISKQTRTQSLFLRLWERERRLDSIEARGVTWEGAKEK